MARQANKLTTQKVKSLKDPGLYADGGNLYLQIGPSGGKAWLFRYMFEGKARNMGLGPANLVSLADARNAAREAKTMLQMGKKDPRKERDAVIAKRKAEEQQGKTFRVAAAECIEAKKPEWKNAKHAAQWSATLETYAYPFIGDMDVAEIGIHDVLRVLNPIWATKTETASRVRMRIETILNYCRELRNGAANPAEWRGNLDTKLAKPTKVKKPKPRPALPFSRMYDFMTEMRKQEGISPAALEFQIYCASRPGEVRFAKWAEIDFEEKIWRIPAERMKAEKPHEVPLAGAAIDLLKRLPRFDGCDWVFTADGKNCISEATANSVIQRMNEPEIVWTDPLQENKPVVAHGFRSSFRDWAGETTNFDRSTVEHALAHQLPDASEASYKRGTELPKRRALMDSWATFCNTKPKQATVTPIKAKATA